MKARAPLALGLFALQLTGGVALAADLAVPEFGHASTRRLNVMSTAADGLSTPRDLEFNPERPGELWVVNRATEGVVIYHQAGTDGQRPEVRKDSFRAHFMAGVSSLAFGSKTNFASCQESNNGGNNFMGPTLWSSDLAIFANVNQTNNPVAVCEAFPRRTPLRQLLGSHIDMLHQSPYCMGIAYDVENAFWAFDGHNGNLIRYDFVRDHGPGYDDHSDARIRRYTDVALRRVPGVPGHIEVASPGVLFIADTGNGRVLKVDTNTAAHVGNLRAVNEPLAEYVKFTGSTVSVFADGLMQPSGVAIHGGRVFVSDHATGDIIAYSMETGEELERLATGAQKIMGLAFSPEGHLWYVDGGANTLVRVEAE